MFASVIRGGASAAIALACCAHLAMAQDFKVDTRIYAWRAASGGPDRARPDGKNTALFHAGKVYDNSYSGHEMMIFEPAHRQFMLLDSARRLSTVVPFETVRKVLYREEQKARAKLDELRARSEKNDALLIERLQFQVEPRFDAGFEAKLRLLTLRNPVMSYQVKCEKPPAPELLEAYLNYADWAARLNYLVESRSLLPTARLQVDEALRARGMLPKEVVREVHHANGQNLTADHKFFWTLNAKDRQTIRYWEDLLNRGDLKRVPFDEYRAPSRKEVHSASR